MTINGLHISHIKIPFPNVLKKPITTLCDKYTKSDELPTWLNCKKLDLLESNTYDAMTKIIENSNTVERTEKYEIKLFPKTHSILPVRRAMNITLLIYFLSKVKLLIL